MYVYFLWSTKTERMLVQLTFTDKIWEETIDTTLTI